MSIATEIARLQNAKQAIKTALSKIFKVEDTDTLDTYSNYMNDVTSKILTSSQGKATTIAHRFRYCGWKYFKGIDTSSVENFDSAFGYSDFEEIEIDASNMTNAYQMCSYAYMLKKITFLNMSSAQKTIINTDSMFYATSSNASIEEIHGLVVTYFAAELKTSSHNTLRVLDVSGELTQNCDIRYTTLLNAESIRKVFAVMSPTATGLTATLSTAHQATVNADAAANGGDDWNTVVASRPNWTITLL